MNESAKLKIERIINNTLARSLDGLPMLIEFEVRNVVLSEIGRFFGMKRDSYNGCWTQDACAMRSNKESKLIQCIIEDKFKELVCDDINDTVFDKDLTSLKDKHKNNLNKMIEKEVDRLLKERTKEYALREAERIVSEVENEFFKDNYES